MQSSRPRSHYIIGNDGKLAVMLQRLGLGALYDYAAYRALRQYTKYKHGKKDSSRHPR